MILILASPSHASESKKIAVENLDGDQTVIEKSYHILVVTFCLRGHFNPASGELIHRPTFSHAKNKKYNHCHLAGISMTFIIRKLDFYSLKKQQVQVKYGLDKNLYCK